MATNGNENGLTTIPVIMVPMNKITAKPEDNCRKAMFGIDELAADIEEEGLLVPMLVRPGEKGQYVLVDGFRRLAALKKLKRKSAEVRLYKGDEKACDLMNLKANIAREDLTTYELAWGCLRLKEKYGPRVMSGAKIADALRGMKGMQKSYVNRLIACLEKAPAYVIDVWSDSKNPAHPAATIENMEKVISLKGSPEKALEKWGEFCGKAPTGGGAPGQTRDTGDGNDDPPPPPPRKLKADEMAQAVTAVKIAAANEEISMEEAEGALGVLKWAMGKVKSLRIDGVVVYDPAKVAKEAKAEKEKEKKAKKAEKEKEKKAKKAERLKAELAELSA